MDVARVDAVATSLQGVRRKPGVPGEWRLRGRLVARLLDEEHLVIRSDFAEREQLLSRSPETFSVPDQFVRHMMVVADLERGDPEAIEDALVAAWALQSRP